MFGKSSEENTMTRSIIILVGISVWLFVAPVLAQDCTDECDQEGKYCNGEEQTITCFRNLDDGCLHQLITYCETDVTGYVCREGDCVCLHECTKGQSYCEGNNMIVCDFFERGGGFTGCEWWAFFASCETGGEICQDGVCVDPTSESDADIDSLEEEIANEEADEEVDEETIDTVDTVDDDTELENDSVSDKDNGCLIVPSDASPWFFFLVLLLFSVVRRSRHMKHGLIGIRLISSDSIKVALLSIILMSLPSVSFASFLTSAEVPFQLPAEYSAYFGPHPYNGDGIDINHRRVMEHLRWCNGTPTETCYTYDGSDPNWSPTALLPEDNVCPNWLQPDFPKDVRLRVLKYLNHFANGTPVDANRQLNRPWVKDYQYISMLQFKEIFAADVAYTFWMELHGNVSWTLYDRAALVNASPNFYRWFPQHLLDARCMLYDEHHYDFGANTLDLGGEIIPLLWNPRLVHQMISDYAQNFPHLPDSFSFDENGLLKAENYEHLVHLVKLFISQVQHNGGKVTAPNLNGYITTLSIPMEMLHPSGVYPELELESGYNRGGCQGQHNLFRAVMRQWNSPVYKLYRGGHAVSFLPDLGFSGRNKGSGLFHHNDLLYSDWSAEEWDATECALDNVPAVRAFLPLEVMIAYNHVANPGSPLYNLDDPLYKSYYYHFRLLGQLQKQYPNFGILRQYCYDWCIENGGHWDCENHPAIDPGHTYWCMDYNVERTFNCECVTGFSKICPGGCATGEMCHNGECCPQLAWQRTHPGIPRDIGFDPNSDFDARPNNYRRWQYGWWHTHPSTWPATWWVPPSDVSVPGAYPDPIFGEPNNVDWNDIQDSLVNKPQDSWIQIDADSCSYYFNYIMKLRQKRNKFKTQGYFQNTFGENLRDVLDRSGNTVYLDWGEGRCFNPINGSQHLLFNSEPAIGTNPHPTYDDYRKCSLDFDGNGPYVTYTNCEFCRVVSDVPGIYGRGIWLRNQNSRLSITVDRHNKIGKDIYIYTIYRDRTSDRSLKIDYSLDNGSSWDTLRWDGLEEQYERAFYRKVALFESTMLGDAPSVQFRYRYDNSVDPILTGEGDIIAGTTIKFAPIHACEESGPDTDEDGYPDPCDICPTTHEDEDQDEDCISDLTDPCPLLPSSDDVDNDCINDKIDNCSPDVSAHGCPSDNPEQCSNPDQENGDYLTETQNHWITKGDVCDANPILVPLPILQVYRQGRDRREYPFFTESNTPPDTLVIRFEVKAPQRSMPQIRHVNVDICKCVNDACDNCDLVNDASYTQYVYTKADGSQMSSNGEDVAFGSTYRGNLYYWNWKEVGNFAGGDRVRIRFSHGPLQNRIKVFAMVKLSNKKATTLPEWQNALPYVEGSWSDWFELGFASSGFGPFAGYKRFIYNPSTENGLWISEDSAISREHSFSGAASAAGVTVLGRGVIGGVILPKSVLNEPAFLHFNFGGAESGSTASHNQLHMAVSTATGTVWSDLSGYQQYGLYYSTQDDEETDLDWEVVKQYVPLARSHAELIFDPEHFKLILYGGFKSYSVSNDNNSIDLKANPYNDINILNLATMRWQHAGFLPQKRLYGKAAYRQKNDELWFFGGIESLGENSEESILVFDLQNSKWREITFTKEPHPARIMHSVYYDFHTDRFILFGGLRNGNDAKGVNDIWVLDAKTGTWTNPFPGGADGPQKVRNAPIMYDFYRDRLIVLQPVSGQNVTNTPAFDFQTGKWDTTGDDDDPPDPDPGCGGNLIKDADAAENSSKARSHSAGGGTASFFIIIFALTGVFFVLRRQRRWPRT
ncbi:hypothetical protein C4565_09800 [Candidatus Parcubacteria bacterium]|nr:MAG: hypothetical protein C4565_09800 [Candidatus Parcubacteria bacterium]